MKHLKVFGSICHVNVPKVKHDKLDHKNDIKIFVEYRSNTKGYKEYNLETNKLIISRNVKVNEVVVWNWENEEIQTLENQFVQCEDEIQEEVNSDDENDVGIKGARPLIDIYERCNVVVWWSKPIWKLEKGNMINQNQA